MLRSTNQFPKTNSIDKSAESSEDEKYKEEVMKESEEILMRADTSLNEVLSILAGRAT